MRKLSVAACAAFFISLSAPLAQAHDHAEQHLAETQAGDLHISEAWARAMLPGQPSGGGYLTIRNDGGEPDTLLSASSPAAGKVEIHTMEMKDDVMVMRPIQGGLAVPAGETVELKPGGLHIMFMQVETPFTEGEEVPLTLEFEKAGNVEFAVPVRPANTGRGGDAHQH